MKDEQQPRSSPAAAYERDVYRVIVFAGMLIVFSMLLVGTITYLITQHSVLEKLKTKDLHHIAQSIGAQVEGRIDRAIETSLMLSRDPAVIDWVAGEEKDEQLQRFVLDKLHDIAEQYDYSNSFIVSAITHHYWAENKQLIDTVSPEDPYDEWFFGLMNSDQKMRVVLDYNAQRDDTFVFVNVKMEQAGSVIAIAGAGLSLQELSQEFISYKDGLNSNLWLVDKAGTIYLSDDPSHHGKKVDQFADNTVVSQVMTRSTDEIQITEYKNKQGEMMDMIAYPIESADLTLLYHTKRSDHLAFLRTIQLNTVIAVLIALLSIILLFVYVSRKLANPYRRALEVNQQLELMVKVRTSELEAQNIKMMDSIEYAVRIQQSMLPPAQQFNQLFEDYFVIWEPRDLVGGDFYWARETEHGCLIAAGDCTGHGVPGALMTVLAISLLNQAVEQSFDGSPASVLGELNRRIKQTLRQEEKEGITDDGLDIGLCLLQDGKAIFAGAACSMYVFESGKLQVINGSRKRLGYRRIPVDYRFEDQVLHYKDACFYISTDGFFDQNGGPQGRSFGKKRFASLIEEYARLPMQEQKAGFLEAMDHYRGEEPFRDDITVLAFSSKNGNAN